MRAFYQILAFFSFFRYTSILLHVVAQEPNGNELLTCSCCRTVPSAAWEIFCEFLIFFNLSCNFTSVLVSQTIMLIWEMPSKDILSIFCLDIGYFNTVRWPIFKFHCWKSKFYLAQFTLIFLYSQKLMPTKKLIYTPHLRDNLILIIFYQTTCTVWTFFIVMWHQNYWWGHCRKKYFQSKL